MRPGLQLKINQQLTMTPQLQQAIRLLQLSTLELRQEVIEQLYSNPLLELEDEDNRELNAAEQQTSVNEQSNAPDGLETAEVNQEQALNEDVLNDSNNLLASATEDTPDHQWDEDLATDLPVDANWDDVYSLSLIHI